LNIPEHETKEEKKENLNIPEHETKQKERKLEYSRA